MDRQYMVLGVGVEYKLYCFDSAVWANKEPANIQRHLPAFEYSDHFNICSCGAIIP